MHLLPSYRYSSVQLSKLIDWLIDKWFSELPLRHSCLILSSRFHRKRKTFYSLSIGKLHLISCKLAIKPVGSIDSSDSSNGHDPKPWCCRSENRNSLLTTDPVIQRCRFDRFVRFVEWTRPETWMLSIGKSKLITDNIPGGSKLSIRPIRSIRWMDTTRNLDVVDRKIETRYWQQTRRFNVVDSTDSFDSLNGHEPKRILLSRKSHLITHNRPRGGSRLSIRPIRSIRQMDTTRNLDVVDQKIASHYWQQT